MTREVPQPHDNAFFFAIKFGSGNGMSRWGNSDSENGIRSLQQIRANLRRILGFATWLCKIGQNGTVVRLKRSPSMPFPMYTLACTPRNTSHFRVSVCVFLRMTYPYALTQGHAYGLV
jgi:hypothetical protein